MQQFDRQHDEFPHHMLREIFEQPAALAATLDRYVADGHFVEETTKLASEWLHRAREIVIASSGSSRHAGLAAELWVEEVSGIHVDVEYASEYAYRSDQSLRDASAIVISQSGGTADTLAALRKAESRGKETLAITNVIDSPMALEADVFMPVLAGRERAIPATKSFTAQLLALWLLSLLAGKVKGALTEDQLTRHLEDAALLPKMIEEQLPEWADRMKHAADRYRPAASFLFLGRGVHYAIAREGALKMKESSYVHAEGYPSGELKHGPNALVSSSVPLVMLATVDRRDIGSVERYEKTMQLMSDMRAQGANILAIANHGDSQVKKIADFTVTVKEANEPLLAICEVIPLQLFSYFMAVNRGIDVDHPRNLVKSVVSE